MTDVYPGHPRETNYSDLPPGQMNLWFVDISNVWKVKPGARLDKKIVRKVLIHHHAGFTDDPTPKHATLKAASGESMPAIYVDIASRGDYQGKPFGYHYDIPYVGETSPDGKKAIVYITNRPDTNAPHTGAGQNEAGVGISLVGYMRTTGKPHGVPSFSKQSDKLLPPGYVERKGLPSDNQISILPVLVRFLQERYNVANPHVQAHFQHGKPECPGFDFERWTMDHEDRPRKATKGFCYPIQLDAAAKDPPFLQPPDKEKARAKDYLLNTLKGRSGLYPFGRRHFWHNGVHLFPPGGTGSPVYAVRDGWVIAARFNKKVVINNIDFGSANFVLIQHEDPGVPGHRAVDQMQGLRWDSNQNKWVPHWLTILFHPKYYSLYMHLKPLDDTLAWVKVLKDKSPDLYKAIQADLTMTAGFDRLAKDPKKKTLTADDLALPVKAGDVIGYVGTHDPFAALQKDKLTVAAPDIFADKNKAVLHFEMFSGHNLVERLDPDKDLYKAWTLMDPDKNALAEAAAAKLEKLKGFKDHIEKLKKLIEDMEKKDPRYADPSLWSTVIDEKILNALSAVIVSHVSEWNADWSSVVNGWFRDWGLSKTDKNAAKKENDRIRSSVETHLTLTKEFQIKWSIPRPDPTKHKPAIAVYPYFYHPIRLLNWLNGLERNPAARLPYNTLTGVTEFDIAPRTLTTLAPATAGAQEIKVAKNTGDPKPADEQQLIGTTLFFPPDKQPHKVNAFEKKTDHLLLKFTPHVSQDVKKGAAVRLGANGWSWESKFTWDTSLV